MTIGWILPCLATRGFLVELADDFLLIGIRRGRCPHRAGLAAEKVKLPRVHPVRLRNGRIDAARWGHRALPPLVYYRLRLGSRCELTPLRPFCGILFWRSDAISARACVPLRPGYEAVFGGEFFRNARVHWQRVLFSSTRFYRAGVCGR